MANFEVFRVERLKTMGNVRASGLHNFREIEVENAISEHFDKNEFTEVKSAEMLFQAVSSRISEVDKKDKQACRCLEFFVSASPEQFAENGKLHDIEDQKRYFDSALNFIKEKHGAENVVCHSVHRDEKSPHMIVYAVPVVTKEARKKKQSVALKKSEVGGPLDEGKGRRTFLVDLPAHTELSAKAFYNCPAALSLLQDEFHAGVGEPSGLDRGISRTEALKHKKTHVHYAEEQAKLDAKLAEVALKEEDVVANFAKIDRHWEVIENDKLRLAADMEKLANDQAAVADKTVKLDDGLAKLAVDQAAVNDLLIVAQTHERDNEQKKMLLDNREAALHKGLSNLAVDQAAVVQDRQALVDGFKKLEAEKTEQIGFFNGIKVKLDRRDQNLSGKEKVVQEKETATVELAANLTQFGKDQTAALNLREAGLDDREAGLDAYKAALSSDMVAFKTDRSAYYTEWVAKMKAAPTEEEKKKAASSLLTPVKKKSGWR
jgi:hypothetical protein